MTAARPGRGNGAWRSIVASESSTPQGPDLEQGVQWDELTDGVPLVGRVGEEAVLVVRRGEEAFAIGASCTHYGGPLGEGLVVGDTVRCPWHHACFSLRTGEPLRAPALNPVACYRVERRGGLLAVTGKRDEPSPRPAPAGAPGAVVIVGAGPAGAACVETLRREGFAGPITLVGDEPPGPVDRPNLSKDYLAGTAPEEWIPLRGPEFYDEHDVDFVLGDPVASLDPARRTVTQESGRRLDYGALVLATGAEPRRLEIPGADGPHVHVLRTLADSRAILARVPEAKRAVVVGASFIGLEAAASLRHHGLEVAVVGPEAVPLERVFGEEIGRQVQRLHEDHGVRFHLGCTPEAIRDGEVELSDGTRLPADLGVVGVGVVPRTALAEAAGLAVDRGIVVDEHLGTSADGVWAAGDVARFPDPRTGEPIRIEHFVVAERQGQAAARSLVGTGGPYRDVPFFWSQHYDAKISYVGHASSWDRIVSRGSLAGGDLAAFYLRDGRVLAVATVDRDTVSLRAEAAIEAGDETALEALAAGD
jgi:NADPH-dependent 2,4-dienoyl-CoA reductase/sulfur reductase-like enzyme/nitrite reductase/ring-hydroxylating ferredoxin subunit